MQTRVSLFYWLLVLDELPFSRVELGRVFFLCLTQWGQFSE
jgi:hypothetical protein